MELAIEGTLDNLPRPSHPSLQSVFRKIEDIEVKRAKEQAKVAASTSRGSFNRGRGRSRGRGRFNSASPFTSAVPRDQPEHRAP